MSRTYKIQAARTSHKQLKVNHSVEQVKELVDVMQRNWTVSLRHGNNRKSIAKARVVARRIERAKTRFQLRTTLVEAYD